MYVLGLNACFTSNHHDPSATLIEDGKPIFAIEEERLNRIKTSAGQFPVRAMKAALRHARIKIEDIDVIALPGITARDLIDKTTRVVRHYFGSCPTIKLYDHEHCHAAGAHFSSGFSESMSIAIDGYGDRKSGCKLHIRDGSIISSKDIPIEKSLGLFYGVFTEYLGFQRTEGEFKVMGMSAYGTPKYDLSKYLDCSDGWMGISSEPSITSLCEPYYSESEIRKLCDGIPERRRPDEEFKQEHFDLAASVQYLFEKRYESLITEAASEVPSKVVTVSGGCGLNCKANSFLLTTPEIKDFYIQPAASDRGLSLGAAYLACQEMSIKPKACKDMYLGIKYSEDEIVSQLQTSGVRYRQLDNVYDHAAESLRQGNIVGWFQGRSEFGPRALGARSILADATISGIKNKINKRIKFREQYRPFAPIVGKSLKSRMNLVRDLEHMTVALFPEEMFLPSFGETIHADGSTRIQTIPDGSTTPISKLVDTFESKGCNAMVNTSFNLAGEPLVEKPVDAIRTFYSSGIDKLYLHGFLLEK